MNRGTDRSVEILTNELGTAIWSSERRHVARASDRYRFLGRPAIPTIPRVIGAPRVKSIEKRDTRCSMSCCTRVTRTPPIETTNFRRRRRSRRRPNGSSDSSLRSESSRTRLESNVNCERENYCPKSSPPLDVHPPSVVEQISKCRDLSCKFRREC